MGETKRKKAALRLREAANYLVTEATAILRMLDEAEQEEETPTVRPPSGEHQAVELPKVEIVKLPSGGRY